MVLWLKQWCDNYVGDGFLVSGPLSGQADVYVLILSIFACKMMDGMVYISGLLTGSLDGSSKVGGCQIGAVA